MSLESTAAPVWVLCLCAEWCGTCRDYRPLMAQVASERRDQSQLRFGWVDIEDHADIADDFDVETFPTLLVVSDAGVHFLGPMLPHAGTLARLLDALPAPQSVSETVRNLLQAVQADPVHFALPERAP